ncbi:hypothetical protein [Paenibacillus thermotolerans]|uniref:hypothetical protein n=1 Tax=Paenibacillus thermotolerans TaxID=3027807 RepID=UPI0023678E55|nr:MULTISPECIES: hypothetical protein [unclassified Paenibacillus]
MELAIYVLIGVALVWMLYGRKGLAEPIRHAEDVGNNPIMINRFTCIVVGEFKAIGGKTSHQ